jgi:hypothetical protein
MLISSISATLATPTRCRSRVHELAIASASRVWRVELLRVVDARDVGVRRKNDRGGDDGPARGPHSGFVDAAISVIPDFHSTSSKCRIACMRSDSRRSLS